MKFLNITLFVVVLFILAINLNVASAEEDVPAVKRISLRRPVGKAVGKTTTTTTPEPAPENEDEGDYGEEQPDSQYDERDELEQQSSTTTTTTEAPKKIGPVIRPFRTNDDFLNSLKRRQMNAKKNRAEKPTPKIKNTPAPESEDSSEIQPEPEHPKPKSPPSKGFKANPALNRRKPIKPARSEPIEDATAEESEQRQEESKPKRPSSRLSLRRRI